MKKTLLTLLLLCLAVGVRAAETVDHAAHHGAETTPTEMQGDNAKLHGSTPAPSQQAALTPSQPVVVEEKTLTAPGGTTSHRLYIARPKKARGKLPAVVLIHEWWGLNENIEAMARVLAGEGYVAGAIDVYGQPATRDPAKAAQMYAKATGKQKQTSALVELAADTLLKLPQAQPKQVGVMGWCFGGNQTLLAAVNMPAKVKAAVVYYGIQLRDEKQIKTIRTPILGLYGEKDSLIPYSSIQLMHGKLRENKVTNDYVVYPGAGHAFANPSAGNEKNYNPTAAADAWARTLSWFDYFLRKDGK